MNQKFNFERGEFESKGQEDKQAGMSQMGIECFLEHSEESFEIRLSRLQPTAWPGQNSCGKFGVKPQSVELYERIKWRPLHLNMFHSKSFIVGTLGQKNTSEVQFCGSQVYVQP